MINIVEDQLDRAAGNLENARRLAGRTARIPTWDMLMLAWSWYVNRDDDRRDSSTQTDSFSGLSWSAEAASRWAYSLSRDELLDHPVVQVALERAVVERKRIPSKGSRPVSWAPRPLSGDMQLIDIACNATPPAGRVDGEAGIADMAGPMVVKPVPNRVASPPTVKGRLVRQKLPKVVIPTRWLVKKMCQMYDDQPTGADDAEPEPVNWDVENDGDSTLLLRKSGSKNKA